MYYYGHSHLYNMNFTERWLVITFNIKVRFRTNTDIRKKKSVRGSVFFSYKIKIKKIDYSLLAFFTLLYSKIINLKNIIYKNKVKLGSFKKFGKYKIFKDCIK